MDLARYTGKDCITCHKPIEIIEGHGTEALQRLAVRCHDCARKIGAAAAEVLWQRHNEAYLVGRRERGAAAARRRREKKNAAVAG